MDDIDKKVDDLLERLETDQKCNHGVARVACCQHGRCSSCRLYYPVRYGVSKCLWDGWEDG